MSAARDAVTRACPELAELVDVLRSRFQARLVYVKTKDFQAGANPFPEPGLTWTPYEAPKVKRGKKG